MLLCLLVVIAYGVVARLVGQTTIELWADEADWAIRAATGTDTFIRPAGSMWLARQLIALRNDEILLRLPSLIAGIATLPLLFAVLRRLVRPAVAVVVVALFVAHPVALGMSREFKPYAVEAALHLAVLLLALRLLHRHTTRDAGLLATLTTTAPVLSWSIVFAYPGAYLLALRDGLESWRRGERRTLPIIVGGIVATLTMLAALFALRVGGEDRKTEYWGTTYDVFFVGDDGDGVLAKPLWVLQKLVTLLQWPGRLDLPTTLRGLTEAMAAIVVVVGVVALMRQRRWRVLLLLVLPFVTTLVFNLLGQWPWGRFRTNFHLLPLASVLLGLGLDLVVDGLAKLHHRGPQLSAVVVGVALVAMVPRQVGHFDRKLAASQTGEAQMHRALALMHEAIAATTNISTTTTKQPLLLDKHACGLFRYYTQFHADAAREHGAFFAAHVDDRCVLDARGDGAIAGRLADDWFAFVDEQLTQPVWVMTVQRALEAKTVKRLRARCAIDHEHALRGMTLLHCTPRPDAPAAAPATAPTAHDDVDE